MLQCLRGSCVLTLLRCHALLKPRSGISAKDIEADFRDKAEREVVNFNGLTVADSKVGSKMLHALLESPLGMKSVVDKTSYEPREIAA